MVTVCVCPVSGSYIVGVYNVAPAAVVSSGKYKLSTPFNTKLLMVGFVLISSIKVKIKCRNIEETLKKFCQPKSAQTYL